jgi:hypothetical protein
MNEVWTNLTPSRGRLEKKIGISCEKNHDFMPKNLNFFNFRGAPGVPAPDLTMGICIKKTFSKTINFLNKKYCMNNF